jgi:ParB family transcriptional regulator, chromosome partitioning protein
MPKASRDSLKAKGKTDVYFFDPNDLVLVKDKDDPLYDARVEDSFDEDLVKNMMHMPDGKTPVGIIEPVIGRRNTESGKVEVVAGRGRVLAAREANCRFKTMGGIQIRVPVWIKRLDDSSAFAALVSENEHRRADSPLNRAKKVQRYMNLGHGEKEAAVLFGVSEATVRNMLLLLDAPAVVRQALDRGKITTSAAYGLAREEPSAAREKLGKLLEQAPREAGKKKQSSANASKARAILRGPGVKLRGRPAAPTPPEKFPDGTPKVARDPVSLDEDRIAEAVARWIESNWNESSWSGSPADIPKRIRAGEWRKAKATTNNGDRDGDDDRQEERDVGAVDA